MASYQVEFSTKFEKEIGKIPAKDVVRIFKAIEKLPQDPNPPKSKKLVGYDNSYRLRVGDYRVIYEIQNALLVIYVVEAGHRKDIYCQS